MSFVIRKVRSGRVKIGGKWFVPDRGMPYDGSLEGKRFAFGRYPKHDGSGEYEPFVNWWGPEEHYCSGIDPDTPEGEKQWQEWCKMASVPGPPTRGINTGSGNFIMAQDKDGEFLAFRSRGWEFWHVQEKETKNGK